jgi:nucleoside-diphosphate-sugar epimerase
VARVVAFVPDLLFGSNVVGALRAAGHDPVLVSNLETLSDEGIGAEALIVDLTFEAADRIEQVRLRRPHGLPVLAFYSHVEADVRTQAEQAGFDLVVPRSRMAREGAALVDRLLSAPAD